MKKNSYEFYSASSLFSPTVLVRDFGTNPKIVLNPAFDKTLQHLFHYKDSDKGNSFYVSETKTEHKISSFKKSDDGIPYNSAIFSKDGSKVTLEYFNRGLMNSYALGEINIIERLNSEITTGDSDKLIVDSTSTNFEDSKNGNIRNLYFTKKSFDASGVLDSTKLMALVKNRINLGDVKDIEYEKLLYLISQYKNIANTDLYLNLGFGIADVGSHEIHRDPNFIEKASLLEIVNINEKKELIRNNVSLYNGENYNNIYNMHYSEIIRNLDPVRFYKEMGRSEEEIKNILNKQKNCIHDISLELLYELAEDKYENDITTAEIKRRIKQRPNI